MFNISLLTFFITIVTADVRGQSRLYGIYSQDTTSFENTPGRHDYISLLELDRDNSFYMAKNFKCVQTFCSLAIPAPISGTYEVSKERTSLSNMDTFVLNFTPEFGSPFEYKVTIRKNQRDIQLKDNNGSYTLRRKNDICLFRNNDDTCARNINSDTQCATDNRCRVTGRLGTSCETSDDCNSRYRCAQAQCKL